MERTFPSETCSTVFRSPVSFRGSLSAFNPTYLGEGAVFVVLDVGECQVLGEDNIGNLSATSDDRALDVDFPVGRHRDTDITVVPHGPCCLSLRVGCNVVFCDLASCRL